ncbi:hypothetical protein ILUMI_10766 [Ignelater luminosus]|uniref:Inter-alpha-trypsin inhibitor heavy chain H4-like n=1 Tax=Ignelater luminosus TaxID=2038154 RepID=A0A8K0GDB5_IGNLU|nr:hypothetical protein ILUMI_10766 [Ignelater luminosus]
MDSVKLKFVVIIALCFGVIFAAPADSKHSLIVSSTESSNRETNNSLKINSDVPRIYQMHVKSNISNRFARTTITSKVRNIVTKSLEAVFSIVLPETAFISGFIMEIGGKNYTAYVKEKEEAKKEYEQAVASGLGAAHVAVSVRDSNRFTISVNMEPQSKAAFYLTYEELLKRGNGYYEQVINLHPGQPVKDLRVEVLIAESRKIVDLKAPPLRSGNEIGNENADLDPRADLKIIDDKTAIVRFNPNLERQKQLAHLLGTNEDDGLAGQFVVQYDVERDPNGGEVLIQDGYFVHFFAPTELAPLPKHIVFVLDTSSSMEGEKIKQLKEAMDNILGQLHTNDSFSLVEFNTNAKVLDLNNPNASVWYPHESNAYNYEEHSDEINFEKYTFPNAYLADSGNIKKAKDIVSKLIVRGGTDIHSALKVGLRLVELANSRKIDNINRQPIIVFLTDGDPTVRITSTEDITYKITTFNVGLRRSPIFALSFGELVDKEFLKKLAFLNAGFTKHIYEAADAALQLRGFYEQISSPLLANVTFKYGPSVTSLTKTNFPIHFGGSELIVSGKYGTNNLSLPIIKGWGAAGDVHLQPLVIERPASNIERLWAYLTIKQLLELKEVADTNMEKKIKKKALDLALRYSFVTSVSSLVVVKPNSTDAVETEKASSQDEEEDYDDGFDRFGGYQPPANHKQQVQGGEPTPTLHTTLRPKLPSTTTVTSAVAEGSSKYKLLVTALPWLKNVLNMNGILNLPSGGYKLGLNETITDNVDCLKSPIFLIGHCSLLHNCPHVHSLLTSLNVYNRHACILRNEYAGVCCPDKLFYSLLQL